MNAPVVDRPTLEVGDVIRTHGADFRAKYGGLLSSAQRKALRDLGACRTAALGGHVAHCLDCGRDRIAYNSCRNRHCPKCQALARARWLEREADHLLPVEYHHVVFTLPAALADLALANRMVLYDLLFQTAAATLRAVAANPKRLGAMLGVLLVLHTWGQTLQHHPHVHGVVTGGGLSCHADGVLDDAPRWVSCRPGFLLPVRVLSRVFRGKFLDGLRTAFARGQLRFPGRLAAWAAPAAFAAFTGSLAGKEWVVYSKPPFGGPQQVLKYLARYTHRVALSNSRLVALENGRVTFRYQDYADDRKHKTMTLPAEEFLRRFVQHVLPKGFVKVRHYGLLANRCREQRLHRCRRLLLAAAVATPAAGGEAAAVEAAPRPCCPSCGSERIVRRALGPAVPAPPPGVAPPGDTS
jgi:Putative transposase/Transposase zinc-binding domain